MRRPLLTSLLVALNAAVFTGMATGVLPIHLEQYAVSREQILAGRLETVLLAGFIHAGLTHIVYNMVFLGIFGSACEQLFGQTKMVAVYAAGLITGSAFFVLLFPYAQAVGASGAVFALMAAAMLIDPRRPLHPRLPLPLGFIAVAYLLPALVNAFETGSGVANIAHVGGAAAGAALAFLWEPQQARHGLWVAFGFAVLLLVLGL